MAGGLQIAELSRFGSSDPSASATALRRSSSEKGLSRNGAPRRSSKCSLASVGLHPEVKSTRSVGVSAADAGHEVRTGDVRQVDVADHEVDIAADRGERAFRLRGRRSHERAVPDALQGRAHDLADRVVVVHDQNRGRPGGERRHRRRRCGSGARRDGAGSCGEAGPHGRSSPGFAVDGQVAPDLVDDAADGGEAEARAPLLGGEERLEDPRKDRGRDPHAIVDDLDVDLRMRGMRTARSRPDRDRALTAHRVLRVDEEVHHELIQGDRVEQDGRQPLLELEPQLLPSLAEALEESGQLLQVPVEIDGPVVEGPPAAEREELTGQRRRARRRVTDELEVGAQLSASHRRGRTA